MEDVRNQENMSVSELSFDTGCCIRCGQRLDRDGMGATKRFLNRAAEQYYCTRCLAARLKVPHSLLLERIELLRLQGCTLFV